MPASISCTGHILLIAAAIISSTYAQDPGSHPPRLPDLFQKRDLSCSSVDSKLPSSFTCPAGTNCVSLDNSSSALCCPESSSCDNIQTISCDVSSQNATAGKSNGIFTTRLGDKLPTCGNSCCPFGYACVVNSDGGSECTIIKDTSIVGKTDGSSGNTSSSSATASTTTSATSTASATLTSSTSTLTGAGASASETTSQCNKFPIGVFLAGLFPGMFLGAFLMLAWVICSGRHRKPSSRHSTGSSVYKPTISDPIPMADGGGLRTDFLRKTTDRAKSMFSTKSNRNSQEYVNNWKMPTPPLPTNVPTASGAAPVTPERRYAHDSTTESIKVYSPPSATVVPPIPGHIAPLRGMATQRPAFAMNSSANNMGSPFQTPPSNGNSTNPNRMSATLRDDRGVSVFSGVSELSNDHDGPMLTPARYDGGFNSTKRTDASRPTTTFTEMLHEAGFPDPMMDQHQDTPAVPKIPDGYTRSKR